LKTQLLTVCMLMGLLRPLAGWAGVSPETARPVSGVHGGYQLTSLLPAGFEPEVGAMEWLPDGKLVLVTLKITTTANQQGPSDVYILDGVRKGGAQGVTVKKFAGGFYTPLGVAVVGSRIFVQDNKEGIVELLDKDGDGVSEERRIIYAEAFNAPDRKWSAGLIYKDGFFYAALGVAIIPGGFSEEIQRPMRGCVLKISLDGKKTEIFSGGLRNVNGLAFAPDGELFATDNQGDWVPSCKLMNLRPGRFFGHPATPFEDKPVSPPALWLPHGVASNSTSQILPLLQGPYTGQMLMGDVHLGGISRAFLEKVNGEYQGAVFAFSRGFQAGVNRLLAGPDGSIIVGGAGGPGNWGEPYQEWFDLARLDPVNKTVFEMKAVRSLSSSEMEIEFTKPIAAEAAQISKYLVRRWWYKPTTEYGGPSMETTTLALRSAQVSADGRKAVLAIDGLKTGHVIHIRLSGLKSREGDSLWSSETWYTLNAFGPGSSVAVAERDGMEAGRGWLIRGGAAGSALVHAPMSGPYRLNILDARGRRLGAFAGGADGDCLLPGGLPGPGLYWLDARNAASRSLTKVVMP
jgi:hypothetical protein